MKTQKVKNTAAKRAKSKNTVCRPKVVNFKIAEHKHTGKLIHHKHTSHLALLLVLIITGVCLYFNKSAALAQASSSVSVSVIVPGPAPTQGAVVDYPKDGTVFKEGIIKVRGTCQPNTYVVIKSNNTSIGSTVCSSSGSFELKVQLLSGENNLTALNYDNLNQPGPTTLIVRVTYDQPKKQNNNNSNNTTTSGSGSISQTVIDPPITPSNPSVIPGINSTIAACKDYDTSNLPTGGDPHISVVCVPRLFEPNIEQVLGVIVWGGNPPYAVSVNWGDGSDETLISLKTQSYKKETFSYKNAGNFNITFKLKDSNGDMAIAQTAVQVNGSSVETSATLPISALASELVSTSWLKTPVPFYILAVAVTLGFWGGDIFDQKFGKHKYHRVKRHKIARS